MIPDYNSVPLRCLTLPKVNRFFIYKEYGAKYEMMMRDMASMQRAMPALETNQKGIEILASSLGSEKSCTESPGKRALTIADLLVKVRTSSAGAWLSHLCGDCGQLPLTRYPADSEDVQISPLVCRAFEGHAGGRLCQFPYGGRKYIDPPA